MHFLIGSGSPVVVSVDESLLSRDNEVDEAGGATGNGCLRALVEVVNGGRAHEGKLQVHVGVDTTWHDQLVSCVKDLIKVSTRLNLISWAVDTLYLIILNDNVGLELSISIDNCAILDKIRGETPVLQGHTLLCL